MSELCWVGHLSLLLLCQPLCEQGMLGGAAGTEEVSPCFHTHPPVLGYWKEQMQMEPRHNTQNTLPRFLGAHSKLKPGSPWGLTFSLVQTTSAPRQA